MDIHHNSRTGSGIADIDAATPFPGIEHNRPSALLERCPAHKTTPLVNSPRLAEKCGTGSFVIKDERNRMGLGSFKALGAAYVIACDAVAKDPENPENSLNEITYVTASAGNHGLSVAAGAAVFGAKSVVYISRNVPESFATRLGEKQALVVRKGDTYEESMEAAANAARENGWHLLSDSSWPGYFDVPHRLMEGYLHLATELNQQLANRPSHLFLQAGVGGFAASMAAFARRNWGEELRIVIVEPTAAPPLQQSVRAGRVVRTSGPQSSMGRLDCKEPSLIGLKGLARDADDFVTITDEEVESVLPLLDELGLATTPSGAAGIAAAVLASNRDLQLTENSTILAFITEGVE